MHYSLIAAYELVIVFSLSAFMKSLSIETFIQTMKQLRMGRYSKSLAILVIGLEWAAAVMMIAEPIRWAGQAAAAVLLISFTWAVWRAKQLEGQVQCSCFGQGSQQYLGRGTVVRIVVLAVVLGISLIGLGQERETLDWQNQLLSALIAGGAFAIVWLIRIVWTELKAGNAVNHHKEAS